MEEWVSEGIKCPIDWFLDREGYVNFWEKIDQKIRGVPIQ